MPPTIKVPYKLPDLNFSLNPMPAPTDTNARHVSPNGNNTNDGRTPQTAWKTITYAAKNLRPGQVAYVHAGPPGSSPYREKNITTGTDGLPDKPIWLVAAPGEEVVINGTGRPADKPFILVQNSYWIIEGFEINAANTKGFAVWVNKCNHVIIRDIEAHHGVKGAAVTFVGATDVALYNSRIHHYTNNGRDSHGTLVQADCNSVLIKNNISWKNYGDSVQCVTNNGTNPPKNVIIEENRFFQDYENAVDLKECSDVIVRGNKFFGYASLRTTSRQGAAIVAHSNATNILIEKNRIWNCGLGASFGSADNGPANNIVFRRNLIFDMKKLPALDEKGNQLTKDGKPLFSPGGGVRVSPCSRIEIYHNTFYDLDGYGISIGDEAVVQESVILNNIIMNTAQCVQLVPNNVPGLEIDNNLYWTTRTNPDGQVSFGNRGNPLDWNGWQALPGVYDVNSNVADPEFIADPKHNDFFTERTSWARNRAAPISIPQGITPCGAGFDIGFLETCP